MPPPYHTPGSVFSYPWPTEFPASSVGRAPPKEYRLHGDVGGILRMAVEPTRGLLFTAK